MDRSLIFFYSFIGLAVAWGIISLVRDRYRWYSIALLASLIAGMLISALFLSFGSGVWFITSMLIAAVIPVAILLPVFLVRAQITKKRLMRTVEGIRRDGIAYLSEQPGTQRNGEWHNKEWYVLNSPAQNIFEIGINPYHLKPVIGEKFSVAVLSGRIYNFRPQYIIPITDINAEIVCRLSDFYAFTKESQNRVNDYLEAIKNNVAEPWKVISPEPDKPA